MKDLLSHNLSYKFIFFIAIGLCSCNKDFRDTQPNNWEIIYQNDDLDLRSIKSLDDNNVFVYASVAGIQSSLTKRVILSSDNAGENWKVDSCSPPSPSQKIVDIFPLNSHELLGISSHVYKSIDGGISWINVSASIVSSSIDDIHILDSLTWIVATGHSIYRTTNAGQDWELVFNTLGSPLQRFSFPTSQIGYISRGTIYMDAPGSNGQILKTIDAGQNWFLLNPDPWNTYGTIMPYPVSFQFVDEFNGFMSTFDDYKLYKTTDGGSTWLSLQNSNPIAYLLHFTDIDTGYYAIGSQIFCTYNGGKNWNVDYEDFENSVIIDWTFTSSGQGFAITRDQKILKSIK